MDFNKTVRRLFNHIIYVVKSGKWVGLANYRRPHYILSQDDDLASDNHTNIIVTNLPSFTLVSGVLHGQKATGQLR